MKTFIAFIVSFCALLFMAESLQAQLCWVKFDPENCQYRVITEFGLSKRLNPLVGGSSNDGTQINIDMNLGLDYKVRDKMGLGGVLFADFDQLASHTRYGIRPRVSYFPNNKWDLNFSPGVIFTSAHSSVYQSSGISLETGATYKNYVGLYSRIDFLNRTDGQAETSFNLGIKTAGPAGLVSSGGCIVIGGVAVGLLVLLIVGILGGL
jgi:hypothetical protein